MQGANRKLFLNFEFVSNMPAALKIISDFF